VALVKSRVGKQDIIQLHVYVCTPYVCTWIALDVALKIHVLRRHPHDLIVREMTLIYALALILRSPSVVSLETSWREGEDEQHAVNWDRTLTGGKFAGYVFRGRL
jgi:hypothetical protein